MGFAITGQSLITTAFQTLQVYSPQDTIVSADMDTGLFVLQEMIDAWVAQNLTWLTSDRHLYSFVANQGGIPPDSSPYTLGPGGDFDTGTLPRPAVLIAANLVLNTTTPAVRVPLSMETDLSYFSEPIPNLSNVNQPTKVYYNPTDPLGQVYFWPVPSDAINQPELLFGTQTATFASLTATYTAPPSYARAFRLELSRALIPFFAVPASRATEVKEQAEEAMAVLKARNVKMSDLPIDGMYTMTNGLLGTSYNILTDSGG